MGILSKLRRSNQNMVSNIENALALCRKRYSTSAFRRVGRSFGSCVPTLTPGYGFYLPSCRRSPNQLLPIRHARNLPQHERMDRPLAEAVIRETWNRMRPGPAAGNAVHASHAAAFAGAG
ncbi:MAG TPA: hypothetical protein VK325_03670 [Pseudoxanthomonas sp.]|nr:hypothetical protein [Pseudoxanthomonas sp.]